MMSNKRKIGLIILLGILLCACGFYVVTLGNFHIDFASILAFVGADMSEENTLSHFVIFEIRIPRVLAAIVVGGSLALSGGLYQGIVGNPLVSPTILGVLNGASFGAGLGILLGLNIFGIEALCFVFGIVAMLLALALSWVFDNGRSILMLILGGMIVSAFFGAGMYILKILADPYNTLPSIVFWLMGSLSNAKADFPLYIACAVFALSMAFSVILSRSIDILNLDEQSAQSLGVNVRFMRIMCICIATLLASCSVALAGVIGWVGLVIPHIARFIMGANHRFMLPFCALFGALFLLICDTFARSALATEIPLGIITAMVGIPIFVITIYINKRAFNE
ncbi:iron ABC transporter permease [Helicobacter mastomyrinus]|uniref:Iron ABC transporter permease n=1 Tax=Helicobacter mastomyrinus TaxID=287948 RepID=A0ABZ3F637_9HELI